jgi:hypothetical protein
MAHRTMPAVVDAEPVIGRAFARPVGLPTHAVSRPGAACAIGWRIEVFELLGDREHQTILFEPNLECSDTIK